MSFSFTLFEHEIESTLSTAIDQKVAAMEPGNGKDAVELLSPVITKVITQLSKGEVEFSSVYVTGDITDRRAQLNVNVSFKDPNQVEAQGSLPMASSEHEESDGLTEAANNAALEE